MQITIIGAGKQTSAAAPEARIVKAFNTTFAGTRGN